MNGVLSAVVPVSVLSTIPVDIVDDVRGVKYHQYLFKSLGAYKEELVLPFDYSFNVLVEKVFLGSNLWQLESFIYPFVVVDWDGDVNLLWRVNSVCLEFVRLGDFEYNVVLYNTVDLMNGVEPVIVDCNRMVTEIEKFFVSSSTLLRDAGVDWYAYLVR